MTLLAVESSLLLSELLPTERVRVPLGSHSRSALFRELVTLALPDAQPAVMAGVLQSVEAREREISTALGGGLAVPHGRTSLVSELRLAAGLVDAIPDYVGPDGIPVRVAFLVLTPPDATRTHVQLLAKIARVMHDPRQRAALTDAASADAFVQALQMAEAA
jgi:mannitol/fructose-specific phosphotransferase system IIA component (Ntr-type)